MPSRTTGASIASGTTTRAARGRSTANANIAARSAGASTGRAGAKIRRDVDEVLVARREIATPHEHKARCHRNLGLGVAVLTDQDHSLAAVGDDQDDRLAGPRPNRLQIGRAACSGT